MDLSFYATRVVEELQAIKAAIVETAEAQRAPHVLQRANVQRFPGGLTPVWYCWTGTLGHQQGVFQHCTGVYGAGATPAEACASFDCAWKGK